MSEERRVGNNVFQSLKRHRLLGREIDRSVLLSLPADELNQRQGYLGAFRQKATVEICDAKELLEFGDCLRQKEVAKDLYLEREDANAVAIDQVTKKLDLVLTEYAFVGVDNQAILVEAAEHSLEMQQKFLLIVAGDEDVVNIDAAEVKTAQKRVDEPMEGLVGVPESKRHKEELGRAEQCGDGGFRDVFLCYWNLVINSYQIDREQLFSSEKENTVVYVRERIYVRNSYGVQRAIIFIRTPVPRPRLRDRVQRGSPPATRRTDDEALG